MEEIISAAEDLLLAPATCTRQSVLIAAQNVKFPSSPPRAALFTAGTASRSTENRDSKSRNFFFGARRQGRAVFMDPHIPPTSGYPVSPTRECPRWGKGRGIRRGEVQGTAILADACPFEAMAMISTGVPHCWMVATSSLTTTSAVTGRPSCANSPGRSRGR
jgi:hypothetical protein